MLNQQPNQIWKPENLSDPNWFIPEFFNCELWDKEKEIAQSVKDNKITAVRSCHDSGKSFIGARIALWYLETHKDSKVLTTAPGWTQVKEILWNEMHSAYNSVRDVNPKYRLDGRMLETKFDKSPDWFAIGIATRKEGEAGQVADRMLGFHSKTGQILIIIDEGSGVLEPIWGAVEALMTSAYAKLLALGNPYKLLGGFAKLFKQKEVNKIHIQDTDIPNIKENRIIIPGLMSPDYPREMAGKYGIDSNIYLVKVKGEFPRSETDTLIPIDDVEKAFLRETEPEPDPDERKRLGVDVARYGDDMTVLLVRQGNKVLRKETYGKENTMQTVGRVLRMMEEEIIKPVDVDIDDIGVGGGVVDRLQEKGCNVNGVNVGMVADDEEHYANIRAENYWAIKSWIKTANLPKDDDFYELANLKYKWKSEQKGQLLMESKKDMKKRIGHSPDTADALMLTFTGSAPSPFPEPEKPMGDVEPGEGQDEGRPYSAGIIDREF